MDIFEELEEPISWDSCDLDSGYYNSDDEKGNPTSWCKWSNKEFLEFQTTNTTLFLLTYFVNNFLRNKLQI